MKQHSKLKNRRYIYNFNSINIWNTTRFFFFLDKVSGDETLLKSLEDSKAELKRVTDELNEIKNSFADKNDQVWEGIQFLVFFLAYIFPLYSTVNGHATWA